MKSLFQNPKNDWSRESVQKVVPLEQAQEDPSFQYLTGCSAVGGRCDSELLPFCGRDGWSVGEGGLSPPGGQHLPTGNVLMEGGRGEAGGQGACFQGGPAGICRKG